MALVPNFTTMRKAQILQAVEVIFSSQNFSNACMEDSVSLLTQHLHTNIESLLAGIRLLS